MTGGAWSVSYTHLWLIRILICGGCLVGAGILLAFIGIKIAGLYKKYCWDMITILAVSYTHLDVYKRQN